MFYNKIDPNILVRTLQTKFIIINITALIQTDIPRKRFPIITIVFDSLYLITVAIITKISSKSIA